MREPGSVDEPELAPLLANTAGAVVLSLHLLHCFAR